MSDLISGVAELHRVGGVEQELTLNNICLREGIISEEYCETLEAMGFIPPDRVKTGPLTTIDLVETADGCGDLAYVAIGSLISLFGEEVCREVITAIQDSNMAKFPGGVVLRKPNGKIAKPEGWTPPDIAGILIKHGIPLKLDCI
jgi:hypothetical protein